MLVMTFSAPLVLSDALLSRVVRTVTRSSSPVLSLDLPFWRYRERQRHFRFVSASIDKSLFQSGSGTNNWNITSQNFETSTLQGGSGIDTVTLTSGNEVRYSYLQGNAGIDTIKLGG